MASRQPTCFKPDGRPHLGCPSCELRFWLSSAAYVPVQPCGRTNCGPRPQAQARCRTESCRKKCRRACNFLDSRLLYVPLRQNVVLKGDKPVRCLRAGREAQIPFGGGCGRLSPPGRERFRDHAPMMWSRRAFVFV
jgi:hypothetical protein